MREKTAYLFMFPWIVGFVTLVAGPIASALYLSFTDYTLLAPPRWVGFDNYLQMATDDPRFFVAMKVTFTYVITSVPLKLTLALVLAAALNQGLRGLSIYRALFYIPPLLGGSVAIAVLWRQLFAGDGLLNQFLLAVFGWQGPSWISDPDYALYTLVFLNIWQFGSPLIIFLAGLRQIPRDLYEAAEVDGVSRIRCFFRITVPLLSPVIFFNAIIQMIDGFKTFTPAFVISRGYGGPADSTLFYTLYLYSTAFVRLKMGYATALAWVLLAIIAASTAVIFFTSRYWVHYDE